MADIQTIQLPLKIDHSYKLWFGSYNGKSLEQIALTSYCYFDWLKKECGRVQDQAYRWNMAQKALKNIRQKNPQYMLNKDSEAIVALEQNNFIYKLSQNAKDTIEGIKILLNRYQTAERCKAIGCQNPAGFISIAGDRTNGYSVGKEFVYCKSHKDVPLVYTNKAHVLPIKHGSLVSLFGEEYLGAKFDSGQSQKVFNSLAGFEGAITKDRSAEFFMGLESKLAEKMQSIAPAIKDLCSKPN